MRGAAENLATEPRHEKNGYQGENVPTPYQREKQVGENIINRL
jgi:hypothetical protein